MLVNTDANPASTGLQLELLPDKHDHFNRLSLKRKVLEYKLLTPRALRRGKLQAVTAATFMMHIRFQERYAEKIRMWATRTPAAVGAAPSTRCGEWKRLLVSIGVFFLLLWAGCIMGFFFPLPVACKCQTGPENGFPEFMNGRNQTTTVSVTVGYDACVWRYENFYNRSGAGPAGEGGGPANDANATEIRTFQKAIHGVLKFGELDGWHIASLGQHIFVSLAFCFPINLIFFFHHMASQSHAHLTHAETGLSPSAPRDPKGTPTEACFCRRLFSPTWWASWIDTNIDISMFHYISWKWLVAIDISISIIGVALYFIGAEIDVFPVKFGHITVGFSAGAICICGCAVVIWRLERNCGPMVRWSLIRSASVFVLLFIICLSYPFCAQLVEL